jgi:hypothetical protein
MQTLKTIIIAVITLGFLSNILIVSHYSTNCLQLVWVPYVILLGLTLRAMYKSVSADSFIAVFVTALVFSIISALAYGEVSYSTSHKSTEALVFFILPVFSMGLIPFIYLVTILVMRLIMLCKEITKA